MACGGPLDSSLTDRDLRDVWRETIERIRGKLIENLEAFTISQIRCFTDQDRERIYAREKSEGNARAVALLLMIIVTKDDWWTLLLEVLRDRCAQEWLAERLETEFAKVMEDFHKKGSKFFHSKWTCDCRNKDRDAHQPVGDSHTYNTDTTPGNTQFPQYCLTKEGSEAVQLLIKHVTQTNPAMLRQLPREIKDKLSHCLPEKVITILFSEPGEVEQMSDIGVTWHNWWLGSITLVFDVDTGDLEKLQRLHRVLSNGSFPKICERALNSVLSDLGLDGDYVYQEAKLQKVLRETEEGHPEPSPDAAGQPAEPSPSSESRNVAVLKRDLKRLRQYMTEQQQMDVPDIVSPPVDIPLGSEDLDFITESEANSLTDAIGCVLPCKKDDPANGYLIDRASEERLMMRFYLYSPDGRKLRPKKETKTGGYWCFFPVGGNIWDCIERYTEKRPKDVREKNREKRKIDQGEVVMARDDHPTGMFVMIAF